MKNDIVCFFFISKTMDSYEEEWYKELEKLSGYLITSCLTLNNSNLSKFQRPIEKLVYLVCDTILEKKLHKVDSFISNGSRALLKTL